MLKNFHPSMESSLPHMGKLSQPHHLSPCWVSGCKEGLCWAASFSSIKKKLCHPLQFLHSVTASPSNNSRNLLVVLLVGKISPDQQNKEKKKLSLEGSRSLSATSPEGWHFLDTQQALERKSLSKTCLIQGAGTKRPACS